MTSKFSPPAKAAAKALGWWLVLAASSLQAQTPSPSASASPSPSPTPHKPAGWVRFWNMLPTRDTRLELVSATDPSKAIAIANNMNVTADYNDLPPGKYSLQVFRTGDRQTPLKSLDVPLRDGTYVTVLAHAPGPDAAAAPAPSASPGASPAASGAAVTVDLIDDTPDPAKPDNRVTVRQFSPGARVAVTTSTRQSTDVLNYGAAQTLTALPNGIVPLVVRASTPQGSNTWHTEADFGQSWRSTLLIVNDGYGRFRPRITVDGPPKPTPTPKPTP